MKRLNMLSYAANLVAIIVFAYLYLRTPDISNAGKPASPGLPAVVKQANSKSVSVRIETPRDQSTAWASSNAQSVIAALRELGAPPEVLADVVRTLLMRKYNDLRMNLMFPPGTAKWASRTPVRTPEIRQKIADLDKQYNGELHQLLGADYEKTTINKQQAVIMPGGLSDEKRSKVADLAYDYAAGRRAAGPGSSKDAEDKINAQYVEDLKQVLSPAELHDYLAYNSSLATSLQSRLNGSKVDDQTYVKIYDGLSEFQQAHNAEAGSSNIASSYGYKAGEFQVVRSAGGDQAAAAIALHTDSTFRQIAQIVTAPDNPTAIAETYQQWLTFHSGIETLEKNPPPQEQLVAQRAELATASYAKFTGNLSDTAHAQFDRTPLGMYMLRLMRK